MARSTALGMTAAATALVLTLSACGSSESDADTPGFGDDGRGVLEHIKYAYGE